MQYCENACKICHICIINILYFLIVNILLKDQNLQ
uniref:Uncharacterized protein n=1 Tax=Anguilla anguilla TaxID=7936 RepID=A0A0E9XB02_ANGAN